MYLGNRGIQLLSGVLLSVALVSSANAAKIKKKYFGPDKRFAVVSVSAMQEIKAEGKGSIASLFSKNKSHTDGLVLTKKYLPIVIEELGKSSHFQLVDNQEILGSSPYQSMEKGKIGQLFAKSQKFMGTNQAIPPYKLLKKEKELKFLAKNFNLDGTIYVDVSYRIKFLGMALGNIGGVNAASVGRQRVKAYIRIKAVNKKGKEFWDDYEGATSKKAVAGEHSSADFEALGDSFEDATRLAMQDLLKNLDKKIK